MATPYYHNYYSFSNRKELWRLFNVRNFYDQFISGKDENYKKVYANNFISGMESARKEIAKAINALQK